MGDEAVISGIARRRIEESIHKQRAGRLVHFVFDRLTANRHLNDDIDVLRRIVADRDRLEIHFAAAFWLCRFLIRSSTTAGSASVEVSPSAPTSSSAILRRIRRMIFPERVLGRPGANWMTSGAAIGPISLRTQATSSLRNSPDGSASVIKVT